MKELLDRVEAQAKQIDELERFIAGMLGKKPEELLQFIGSNKDLIIKAVENQNENN